MGCDSPAQLLRVLAGQQMSLGYVATTHGPLIPDPPGRHGTLLVLYRSGSQPGLWSPSGGRKQVLGGPPSRADIRLTGAQDRKLKLWALSPAIQG